MNLSFNISIGKTNISFLCPDTGWLNFLKKRYGAFAAGAGSNFRFKVNILPRACRTKGRGRLKAFRSRGRTFISRYDFHSESSKGLKRTALAAERDKYSFDSWLRVFCTFCGIENRSLLLHAAGYAAHGGVYLFAGRSGKGKSTIIRILGRERALTDELVCVYKRGSGYFASSTPFWGELKKGTGKLHNASLKGIFFLEHGMRAETADILTTASVTAVLKTALFFSRDAVSVKTLLAFAHDIARRMRPRSLYFRKDTSREQILNLIRRRPQ